ncbi:MAG: UV DNA damage repair endonuclease UvsE [Promethearchaeota archaeon]|jgi:UV DNA damage endonuclease
MKIGYPCINLALTCKSSRTFRLKNYSEERLIESIDGNLDCLQEILEYNKNNKIFFFRITSDLIPFGSHPIMKFEWQDYFKEKFNEIGNFIKKQNMRISMHPGQYTVLNSKNDKVVNTSIKELEYHADVLDLMNLDRTAKIMTHIGGIYGDKKGSKKRFIERYNQLSDNIKKRYVIENDDKSFTLADCLEVYKEISIPIVFDAYHHECLNSGEIITKALSKFTKTWNEGDGLPILHYSSQHPIKGQPSHADKIQLDHFKNFINKTKNYNFDLMLEIKDKEQSALKVIKILEYDPRFLSN